jgi:hypothetical protein
LARRKQKKKSDSEAGYWRKTYNPSYSAHKNILREQLERPYLIIKVLRIPLGVDHVVQPVSHQAGIPALLHNSAQKGKS